MSNYLAERILKPSYFKLNHLQSGSVKREPYVIGWDSEAESGYPFLYQFAHPDERVTLLDIPKRGKYVTLFRFIDYLFDECKRKDREYIVFGFNLQYEFTQLFRGLRDDIKVAPEFKLGDDTRPCNTGYCKFYLNVFNNKRYSFTIEFGGTKRIVRVLDAMAFFPMSLDRASEAVGIGRKLKTPKRFTRKDAHTPEFEAYAKQDAILTQKLGEYIVALHREYDVQMTMTAPSFASRVFRHKYLQTEIPLAHPNLEQFGLDSYHGGKNGFYLDGPKFLPEVYHVDIRSAYPEAMRQLPDLETGQWEYHEEYIPDQHAIWEVTGIINVCNYRCLMSHGEGFVRSGIHTIRVTGYELDSAIARDEILVHSCKGYVFRGQAGSGALARYVDDFYKLKRHGENSATIAAAKLFLNSLYGKFFQKVPLGIVGTYSMELDEFITTDPDKDYDYQAGGLYHPAIASLITGYVRAKIHRLEHKYESVMTSTDGFFSMKEPPAEEIGKELGMLSVEKGSLHIWRERLYVFQWKENGKKKRLAALHGWHGTMLQLLRVPLIKGYVHNYYTTVMVTLKMSLHELGGKRYQPGVFCKQKRVLDLSGKVSLAP